MKQRVRTLGGWAANTLLALGIVFNVLILGVSVVAAAVIVYRILS